MKVVWHAIAQQSFHDPRLVRHTCRHSWAIQPLTGMRLQDRITFGQGAHRVRLFRRFDTRITSRHPLIAGADGVLLRWIVSRASGGYSKHARVVRISSTLSRDTTTNLDPFIIHAASGDSKAKRDWQSRWYWRFEAMAGSGSQALDKCTPVMRSYPLMRANFTQFQPIFK